MKTFPHLMIVVLAATLVLFVFGTKEVSSQNLVVNGDFELGNTGFSTDYIYMPDAIEIAAGAYFIGTNPQDHHPLFSPCGDHTTGTGNMMILNGAVQPNVLVWSQSVAVSPNQTFELTAWVTSVFPASPAHLQFLINNSPVGELQLSSTTCQWQLFTANWPSGASTTAVLSIVDLNTDAFGNDFALDDLAFERTGPAFAGTPGTANCEGKSVSALARQFGGLDAAASALGFPSVQALQEAIRAFCEG